MREYTYIDNGISLALNRETCTGCGRCVEVCPHGVFTLTERKAEISARKYCMECGACSANCPVGAITVNSGVGCAAAVINGLLRGTAPDCGCGGNAGGCC